MLLIAQQVMIRRVLADRRAAVLSLPLGGAGMRQVLVLRDSDHLCRGRTTLFGCEPSSFHHCSTYRRVRLFDSPRFRKRFIETLDQLRTEFDFRLVGYVLMPEHFHLLISPSKVHSPSKIVGSLKQRTARHIIENLKRCKERRGAAACSRRSCCLKN